MTPPKSAPKSVKKRPSVANPKKKAALPRKPKKTEPKQLTRSAAWGKKPPTPPVAHPKKKPSPPKKSKKTQPKKQVAKKAVKASVKKEATLKRTPPKKQSVVLCAAKYEHPSFVPPPPPPPPKGRAGVVLRAVAPRDTLWPNQGKGQVITFGFLRGATLAQKKVAKEGLKMWTNLGLSIKFKEVDDLAKATVRIRFQRGDGHYSYVGTYNDQVPHTEHTMNLDPSAGNFNKDTACHEWGHVLGLGHEHQNPMSGLVFDENATYKEFMGPPNRWSKEDIRIQILNKPNASQIFATQFDVDSIMEYDFPPGLVKAPPPYWKTGVHPRGGLSRGDIAFVKKVYPGNLPT